MHVTDTPISGPTITPEVGVVATPSKARPDQPQPRTLVDIFSASVERFPQNAALEAPDGSYTYRELELAADALAQRLGALGIGCGDRVAVKLTSGTAELYLAILGVLRSGAAYVPIDNDDPQGRVDQIRVDSGARAIVTDGLVIEPLTPLGAPIAGEAAGASVSEHGSSPTVALAPEHGSSPTVVPGPGHRSSPTGAPAGAAPTPADDAWVIFTSGSTGRPKGVVVSHRSAAAFVDAESQLWTVLESDRVLAGLSVGFDASCEEMWLAWAHGATLVPAPRAVVRAGVELGTWLQRRKVTVVSTVPTLAALWDESCLHGVRLLILGGEACPEGLGWRLSAGREVWNTYGPTEATVVSTAAPILPGRPITIGWALNGWEVAVMDGEVPAQLGEPGELVIGGIGLGRYIEPELDATRYAGIAALGWDRAYRTGDIVRATPDGIAFVGRQDDQVKVGGRRIELGELEAALQQAPDVRQAAVALRESASGNKLLVGYVVADRSAVIPPDPAVIRAAAAKYLPSGIVPLVVFVDELPISSSGKVDRKALPWPVNEAHSTFVAGVGADGEALTDHEVWVGEQWTDQLGPVPITPHSDFFALGGTSLAAAKLISALRHRYPAVAVADLYKQPTLRTFAQRLEQISAAASHTNAVPAATSRQRLGAGTLQLIGLVAIFAVQAVPWVIGVLAYGDAVSLGTPHVAWVWLILSWVLLASPPVHLVAQILTSRLLLRDIRPGRYSRYSTLAVKLWFADRLFEATRSQRVAGTPWADRYARLTGADVEPGARLGTVPQGGRLLHVGAGATIEGGVDLRGWVIEGQELTVGEITIAAGARVGTRTMLCPGTIIGTGAEIESGSVVQGSVPDGERWGGVPAEKLGTAGEFWPDAPPVTGGKARSWRRLYALSLTFEAALFAAAAVPGILLLWLIGDSAPTLHSSLMMIVGEAAITVALGIPTFAIVLALTLRFTWKLLTPGWHTSYERVGWALWFGEELMQTAQGVLFPLYASVYTRSWLRLMGIEVGKRTEVSTATGLSPLVSFGAYSQSTDDIGFCGVRARDGWIHLAPVRVGDRTFLGPGSILRGGTVLGDDSLVGVLTLCPPEPEDGTSWFGVPALELPRVPDFTDASRTVNPPRRLILARTVMDTVRLLVPNTIVLLLDAFEMYTLGLAAAHLGLLMAIVLAPLVLIAGGVVATAITVALKWIVIGRYRPGEHPLWSWFVWRDELINSSQEQLAGEKLLGYALGTPLMPLYLRAMGAKVGEGCWLESLAVTEYEMINLGDGVSVNRGACLMTHLFHDRLLRIGDTHLESGASLGPSAAVLPDTIVGAGTVIEAHSVVLRGEELPALTRWQGAPVAAR